MRKDVNDMFEINGRVTTAICYAKVIEDEAIEQIKGKQGADYAGCPCRKRLYNWDDHDNHR